MAGLSFLHAAYHRCKADNNKYSLLPSSPALSRNNAIAIITAKADYKLSFEIVPTATIADWASILHFNAGNKDCCDLGNRSPAIWFHPGSTRLHVRIGDSADGNWGIDTADALPLNVRSEFILECKGKDVKLTVGGKVYTATQPTYRYSGQLIVYAGNPYWPVAQAQLYGLDYEALYSR